MSAEINAARVFFVFYGATWLRQDCARLAILIHFKKKNEAGFRRTALGVV